jgi:polyhydroxyalkanoate synthesis regulator phasin
MKKSLITLAILGSFGFSLAEDISNPILRKLVEKGILTKEEALEVEREIKAEAKKEIKKEVKQEVKKVVKEEIKKEDKEKGKITDLVKYITIEDKNSPEFLLGKETHRGLKIRAFDNKDMYVKIGVRIQGTFENYKEEDRATGNTTLDNWDAYLRRARLEVGVGFNKHVSFSMDIRNDKINYGDKGEQNAEIGDAYIKIKKPFGTSLVNFKLYRAKVDVSRTETVKSAWVIHYDRPHIADEAAQFVSHNRRATNIQMYGNWEHKIHYQIAVGDGIYSGKFHDALGNSLSDAGGSIKEQDFMYGGKIILSPIPGWEEKKRTETYFGVGKHIEFGIGYWRLPRIIFADGNGTKHELDRTLINYEFSAHYKGAFIQAEYFDFDGVVKDFENAPNVVGKSNGWYVKGEYVFPQLYYIAPFGRYEEWDKWKDEDGYKLKSYVFGINWYLRGNTIKVGIAYQQDDYGVNLGNKRVKRYKITSQFYF